jgi:betaine-aldehyde dehydrogenase
VKQPVHQMFIGGCWVSAENQAVLEVVDPSTEGVIGSVPEASPTDVAAAVAAAKEAAPGWRALEPSRRVAAVRTFAELLKENVEELALSDAVDSGNPLSAMRRDVRSAADELQYYAGIAAEAKGFTLASQVGSLSYTVREPYGVVGRIIPFNHPAKFAASKSAGPLVAGNCVLLKPSEHTSLSALRIARMVAEVFPPGVFNVLTGRGSVTGSAIVAHPDVPRIAFTGGVPTGRAILRDSAEHIKHVTLELGGKNPMLVSSDVDPKRAARAAVNGMNFSRSQGQSCGSTSRVFVHESIKERFLDSVCELLSELRIGNPRDEETDMGPLAFREHYERVCDYIRIGQAEGATLLVGGKRPAGRDRGFFLEPTVFTDVDYRSRIAQEEIFGPVLSVLSWSDWDQVLSEANSVPYGLTANIWTNDLSKALQGVERLGAGYVWVNGDGQKPAGLPYGGYGQSGLGKEGCLEEIYSYTREKAVAVTY